MSESQIKKVLIIDDSALIRALLTEIIDSDPRLKVVGTAVDPYDAREKIKSLNPHVLTLDIEMPKMNGIAFLKNLMRLRPMPVVMISTLTQEGAPATLEALELGAVDFVPKPVNKGAAALEGYRKEIIEKVVCAANANVRASEDSAHRASSANSKILAPSAYKHNFICAIGASTGGTEAIKEVVCALPENSPPIVVAQHIPATFSTSFSRRVDKSAKVKVYEAQDKQKIEMGSVYIAPGSAHLKVVSKASGYYCRLEESEPVNRHRPSVEVLFDSVLQAAGTKAMGVILTGMGADGADALLRMRSQGCETVAQDEETSVVWGMPGAAYKIGAASKVMSLDKISRYIIHSATN